MKRFYKFLMPLVAIVAMALPWDVQAQTLTVANGTATNTYVPIYGYYCDADQHNQVVYPASMLADMDGSYITSLTFYNQEAASSAWGTTVTVKMMEITDSVLTDLVATTGATTVWQGTVNGTGTTETFLLTTPFEYQGGNLLLDITTTASSYSRNYWYGIARTGASVYVYGDAPISQINDGDDGGIQNFLPKTTFTYNATGSICMPPSGFTFTFVSDDLNFTWVDTTGTSWEFVYGVSGFDPDGDNVVPSTESTTSYLLDTTGMTPNYYDAYVRTVCGSDNSIWVGPVTFGVGITDYLMSTSGSDTLRTCNATVYDDGGNSPYSSSCDATLVILPSTEGAFLSITGSSYTEGSWDYLRIYSGIGTSGELLFDDYGVSSTQTFGPFLEEAVTVTFHSDGSVTYDGFQINVNCIMPSECPRPASFDVAGIAPDSVFFTWVDSTGTDWTIAYGPTGFSMSDTTVQYANFTDTTGAIGGLTPNTTYDFYLMSLCGSDTSWSRMVTARTACTFIDSLPYSTSFETVGTGSYDSFEFSDPCWTLTTDATSYPYVYVSSSSSYAHSGGNGIYWYRSSTAGGAYGNYQCLVLPGVTVSEEHPVSSMQLKFWAKNSSSSYNAIFHVGVMTNPGDISTFVELGTVNTNYSTEWTEYVVALGNYTGNGNFVAIRANYTGSYWYAYVDDVTLEYAPICPPITAINVEGTTTSGAYINWEYQPGLPGIPEQYDIEYLDLDDSTASPVTTTATNPYIFISGLNPSTHYKFKVRVDCGDDGITPWDSTVFATVGFGCAVIDSTTADTVMFSNSTQGQSGCLAYSSWGNTAYQTIYTAEELIAAGLSAGPITGIDLGFTGSSSYDKELTIFIGNTTTTYINNAVIENPQTQVYGPAAHPMNTSGWQHYDFTAPFVWDGSSSIILTTFMNQPTGVSQSSSSGLTGYYVSASNKARFRYRDSQQWTTSNLTEGNAGSTYSYRASIHFYTLGCSQTATCAAPVAGVVSIDSTSADVAWVPGADEASWNTEYRIYGDTVWTSGANGVTATSYTYTNLNPGTVYEFRIVNDCSEGEFGTVVSATTACAPFHLPLTEDFELYSGVFEPDCWVNGSTYLGSSYPNPIVVNLTGDPNKLLLLYNGGYLILPQVNAPLNQLQARFKFVQGGDNVRFLMGLMRSQDLPIDSMIVLDTLIRSDIDTSSSTVFITYPFTGINPAYNDYHLAFWDAFNDNYSFIDDLVIEYIPQCSPATDVTVTTTATTADVSWTAVTGSTGYLVEYGPHNFTPGTGTTMNVTSATASIAGLTSGTTYDLYVYTLCSGNDTSIATPLVEFTTNCAPITALPYSMNFENIVPPGTSSSTVIMPNCWATEVVSTGTAPRIYYTTTTSMAPSQAYCLYFYNIGVAALPEMGVPLNSLMLNFHAYNGAPNTCGIVIGAVDSIGPGYAASFVPIDTVVFEYGNNNEYNIVSFLNGYTGNANRIAIKNYNVDTTATYATVYIDDLTVSAIPSCIPPQRVHTTALSNVSADLAWSISNAPNYNIEYGPHGFAAGTGTPLTSTTQSVSLTGLTPYTQYDVRIVGVCSATDVSDTTVYTFTTLRAAPVTSLPYFCDFSDSAMANAWEPVNGTQGNIWVLGSAAFYGTGDSNALYISSDSGANNSYSGTTAHSYVYRSFVLDAGNYNVSFKWHAQGEGSGSYAYDYLRAYLVPAGQNIVAGVAPYGGTSSYDNAFAAPMAGWIALGGNSPLNQQSTWVDFSDDISITTPGTYSLVFYWGNDGSVYNDPAGAVDNVSVARNVCPIDNIVVDTATGNSVTLSWTASSESYNVEYGPAGFAHGSGIMQNTNTTSITLNGLTSLANYDVYVRGICNAGADTSRWYYVSFATGLCDNPGIVENWDTTMAQGTSSYSPIGYSLFNYSYVQTIIDSAMLAGLSGDITAMAFYTASTSAGSYFTNMDIYMANVSESDLSAGFIHPDANHTFVHVLSNADLSYSTTGEQLVSLDSTFTWDGHSNVVVAVNRQHGSWTSGSSFEAHTHAASKMRYVYQDSGPYSIASVSGGTASTTVGDIKLISCGTGCAIPTIVSTTSDDNSVTFNWTGSASNYEVAAVAGNWVEPTSGTPVVGNTTTVSGLTSGTLYYVGVRAVCDEGVYSNWYVDTVSTTEHPCLAPTNVTASNVTLNGATLSWTPAEAGQTHFEVRVSANADTTYVDANGTTADITGLYHNTEYSVAVRAVCGENNYSDWSAPITFRTATCQPVQNVTVGNITVTTATVNWTANGSSNYELAWGYPGTPRDNCEHQTVNTNSYTISGLEEHTSYVVYVRSVCAEGVYSDWTDGTPFMTERETGIEDVDNARISLYPNPASSTVTLTGIEGAAKVTVVDMNGREVYSGNTAEGRMTIDVSGMAQGAYFVRITGERVNAIRKLIVR